MPCWLLAQQDFRLIDHSPQENSRSACKSHCIASPKLWLEVKYQMYFGSVPQQASNSSFKLSCYANHECSEVVQIWECLQPAVWPMNAHSSWISMAEILPRPEEDSPKCLKATCGFVVCHITPPYSGSSSACDSKVLLCTWKMKSGVLTSSMYITSVNSR